MQIHTRTDPHQHRSTPAHIRTRTDPQPPHFHTTTHPCHHGSTPAHLYTTTHPGRQRSTFAHTHTSTDLRRHRSTPAHIHTNTDPCRYTCQPARLHISIDACRHASMNLCMQVQGHTRTFPLDACRSILFGISHKYFRRQPDPQDGVLIYFWFHTCFLLLLLAAKGVAPPCTLKRVIECYWFHQLGDEICTTLLVPPAHRSHHVTRLFNNGPLSARGCSLNHRNASGTAESNAGLCDLRASPHACALKAVENNRY